MQQQLDAIDEQWQEEQAQARAMQNVWRNAGQWFVDNRGYVATVLAVGGCMVPGAGWALCYTFQGAAYGVRSQQTIAEYGWSGDTALAVGLDGALTFGTMGMTQGGASLIGQMRQSLAMVDDAASFAARTQAAAPAVSAGGAPVAASSAAPASSVIDDVLAETASATQRNLTSSRVLTADEALAAGERWVGEGYVELGKAGSGVFRSADGLRQFRIDANSLMGNHPPGVPHVHFETYAPGARVPTVNNHVPFLD